MRMKNGDYPDLGRHGSVNGIRGEGPALYYSGEEARILDLVLAHTRTEK